MSHSPLLVSSSAPTVMIEGTPHGTPVPHTGNRRPNILFTILVQSLQAHDMNTARLQIARGLSVNYREPANAHWSPLQYAVKFNFVEAVLELIDRGADVNLVDGNGVTALHIAASSIQIKCVKILLNKGANPNALDHNKRSPLHYASSSSDKEEKTGSAKTVVQSLLQSGANHCLRDSKSKLALHNAALAGSTEVVRLLLVGQRSSTVNSSDNEGRTPLHLAVLGSRSLETIQVLLQHEALIDAKDVNEKTPLHLVAERHINNVNEDFDTDCLELLLSHGASVSASDRDGHNALGLALKRTMWDLKSPRDNVLRAVQLLVAKGSCIKDSYDMWRMVETFPSLVPPALNQSIITNTSAKDALHLKVDLDYRPLIVGTRLLETLKNQRSPIPLLEEHIPPPLKNNTEIAMLHFILWIGHKNVLRHPLCQSFLHLKWLKIRKYFLANVLLYLTFALIFTTHALYSIKCMPANATALSRHNLSTENLTISIGDNMSTFQNGVNINQTENVDSKSDMYQCSNAVNPNSSVVIMTSLFLHFFCAVLFLRELAQFVHNPILFVGRFENLLDVTVLVCVLANLYIGCLCMTFWQRKFGAIAIIAVWVRLMLFLGQFPSFGVYIVMFSKTSKNVIKFLAMYMFLLVAFALGFHILLEPEDTFSNPWTSFITSIVMMTGELDYKDSFLTEGQTSSILPFFIFILFIFFIYIILSNLLVGLAVDDIASMQRRSELLRMTRLVELTVQLETFFRSSLMPACLGAFLRKTISVAGENPETKVTLYPNGRNGLANTLYYLLEPIFPSKRLLVKIIEIFQSGYIQPEPRTSLPDNIVNGATEVGIHNFELKKRDRLEYHRAHMATHTVPVPSQPTVNVRDSFTPDVPSLASTPRTYRDENRWNRRLPTCNDSDEELDQQPFLHYTRSLRGTWSRAALSRQSLQKTTAASSKHDATSQNIAEMREMIRNLQQTVQAMSFQMTHLAGSHPQFEPRSRHSSQVNVLAETNQA